MNKPTWIKYNLNLNLWTSYSLLDHVRRNEETSQLLFHIAKFTINLGHLEKQSTPWGVSNHTNNSDLGAYRIYRVSQISSYPSSLSTPRGVSHQASKSYQRACLFWKGSKLDSKPLWINVHSQRIIQVSKSETRQPRESLEPLVKHQRHKNRERRVMV